MRHRLDATTVVSTALSPRYTLDKAFTGTEQLVHLDTVDHRLAHAGIDLAYVSESNRLMARSSTGVLFEQQVHRFSWPVLVSDVEPGPVRDHIDGAAWIRALTSILVSEAVTTTFDVKNDDGKTVARVTWRDGVILDEAFDPVEPLAEITSLRGYQADAEAVQKRLSPAVSTTTESTSWFDQVRPVLALRAAPARRRPMRAGDPAAVGVARALVDHLSITESLVHGVLADVDTEFLHDFRVGIRRMRSIVKLIGHVLPTELSARSATELRWVGDITTPTRDLDVYLLGIDDLAATVSRPADLEPFKAYLRSRRSTSKRELTIALTSTRFRNLHNELSAELAAVLEAPVRSEQTIADLAARALRRSFRKVTTRAALITAESSGEQVHALRKTCKEVRYLLELFRPLYAPKAYKHVVGDFKEIQDVLGDFQDAEVQAASLRTFARDMMDGERVDADAILAMGELATGFDRRQRVARDTLTEHHQNYLGDRAARHFQDMMRV